MRIYYILKYCINLDTKCYYNSVMRESPCLLAYSLREWCYIPYVIIILLKENNNKLKSGHKFGNVLIK